MSNETPSISVVMSVYNGEKYLTETINSVLEQSFSDFEFIIINDCSSDNTLEILRRKQSEDSRIVIIDNEVNLKLPASLNRGIEISKGKYIARIDADDLITEDRFEKQFKVLEEHSDITFVGSLVNCFYDENNIGRAYGDKSEMESIHFNYIAKSGDLYDTAKLIGENTYKTTRLCHSSLFGRSEAFKKLKYREDVFAEDWDLYNRAINRGMLISKIPEVLVSYRIVNSGMCGQFSQQDRKRAQRSISKLRNGILLDAWRIKKYDFLIKFFMYHYIRESILKGLSMLKRLIIAPILKVRFLVMKFVYKNLDDDGIVKLYRILNKVSQYKISSKIPLFRSSLGISLSVLRNHESVKSFVEERVSNHPHINIGLWTIEKKWAMGGLNTILKMIPTLLDSDYRVRIINYGYHNESLKDEFLLLLNEIIGIEKDKINERIEVISATTYRHHTKKLNSKDRFIAGFWEPAEDFIKFRELEYFESDQFIYIIQDYEPSMLYRWGSEYIRSKSTLEDTGYYPIYNNSVFVCGYMKKLGLIDGWNEEQILHGEPCETKPLNVEEMNGDDIKLVFYSRPTVDKNIYQIKINALKRFVDYVRVNMPSKYDSLQIVGIGEQADDVEHEGFTIRNLGKVDYSDYPALLNNFNLGLSCIISPAFAYPCIEFPRAGLVTVVNRFENRDLEKFSENIVSCDNSEESILEALISAVTRIDDVDKRFKSSSFDLPGVGIERATEVMIKSCFKCD